MTRDWSSRRIPSGAELSSAGAVEWPVKRHIPPGFVALGHGHQSTVQLGLTSDLELFKVLYSWPGTLQLPMSLSLTGIYLPDGTPIAAAGDSVTFDSGLPPPVVAPVPEATSVAAWCLLAAGAAMDAAPSQRIARHRRAVSASPHTDPKRQRGAEETPRTKTGNHRRLMTATRFAGQSTPPPRPPAQRPRSQGFRLHADACIAIRPVPSWAVFVIDS